MPSERPIHMAPDLVRAILDGRKTETRRPVRLHCADGYMLDGWPWVQDVHGEHHPERCPYGEPGDLLWVRERARVLEYAQARAWASKALKRLVRVRYDVDDAEAWVEHPARLAAVMPGRCMPNGCTREAARIFLRVTDVRVERVHDIDEAGALAEGLDSVDQFRAVWDDIYDARGLGWGSNPWVWVVTFKQEPTS